MPQPVKKKQWGCKVHCFVWWFRDGVLFIGCAHCSNAKEPVRNPVGGDDLLTRQAKATIVGHRQVCGRPVRG